MRNLLKWGSLALSAVLLLLLLGSLGGLWRFSVVATGSMAPEYPVGTFLVSLPRDPAGLRAGEVVTFAADPALGLPPGATVTHRVVAKERQAGGGWLISTKGDANSQEDPHPYEVPPGKKVPAVWLKVPLIGHGVLFLQEPEGIFSFCLIVTGLILIAGSLGKEVDRKQTRS